VSGARIIVRGSYNQRPLLDTTAATQIEFYDGNGELLALFGKIFSDELWFYSNKKDPDWPQVLARTGFLNNVAPLAGVEG
jgi:hypothetical protein